MSDVRMGRVALTVTVWSPSGGANYFTTNYNTAPSVASITAAQRADGHHVLVAFHFPCPDLCLRMPCFQQTLKLSTCVALGVVIQR